MKPRAGLYTRVSTSGQKERHSLPAQEAMLRDYAKQNDLDVVEHYQDAGLSAKNTDRPELQRLMRDCEEGRLDVALAVELDRTTRNVEDMLSLSRFFRQHNVQYIELTDPDTSIDTPDGFLKRTIKSTISQYERMHTGERIRRAKAYRTRQGKWGGGTPPYGYTSQGRLENELKRQGVPEGEARQTAVKMCPERGKLYIVPDEALVVRDMFDTFIRVNSVRKTALTLNQQGKRTHSGSPWSASVVYSALRNPVYYGKLRTGVKPVGMNGTRRLAKKSDWVIVDGEHEPIISEEVFHEAQRMLPDRPLKPKKTGYIFLFSGLIKCGYCGGRMAGNSQTRYGKRLHSYRCGRNRQMGNTGCPGQWWKTEDLEEHVISYLKGLSGNETFLQDTRTHLQDIRQLLKTHNVEPEMNRLNKDIRKCQQRVDTLLDKLQDGLITDHDFKRRYDALKEDIMNLEGAKARLLDQSSKHRQHVEAMEASFDEILNVWQGWDALTREEQQQRIRTIVEEVRVFKKENHIDVDLIVGKGFYDGLSDGDFLSGLLQQATQNTLRFSQPVKDLLHGHYNLSIILPQSHQEKTV